MTEKFGDFIGEKRKDKDIKLKDIADELNMSVTYLSDIIRGRRNPPEIAGLEKLAQILQLTDLEREYMLDLAGRERNQVSPDLPDYIMDEKIPNARTALRKAKSKGLGDDFWVQINKIIDNEEK